MNSIRSFKLIKYSFLQHPLTCKHSVAHLPGPITKDPVTSCVDVCHSPTIDTVQVCSWLFFDTVQLCRFSCASCARRRQHITYISVTKPLPALLNCFSISLLRTFSSPVNAFEARLTCPFQNRQFNGFIGFLARPLCSVSVTRRTTCRTAGVEELISCATHSKMLHSKHENVEWQVSSCRSAR